MSNGNYYFVPNSNKINKNIIPVLAYTQSNYINNIKPDINLKIVSLNQKYNFFQMILFFIFLSLNKKLIMLKVNLKNL